MLNNGTLHHIHDIEADSSYIYLFIFCIDKDENEIPLPNVKGSVLTKVVQYLTYHIDNPPKTIEKPLKVN